MPSTTARPTALLAMRKDLVTDLFMPEQWRRLTTTVELLDQEPIEVAAAVPEALAERTEILVTGWGAPRIDAAVMRRMPALRAIVHTAGSVTSFITDAVWEREDILVTTAAEANAVPVAEYALAQIVLAGKRSLERSAAHRRARGRVAAWSPTGGGGNYGSVVGLIGASRTGRLTAQRLQPFDIEVLMHDPYAEAAEITSLGARKVELKELFAVSDVVSLHAPDLPSTRNMIGAEHFALMRDGSTFINTARPALVEENALHAELLSGRISAVLDVHDELSPEDPLWDVPTVELTPHIAGSQGNELHRLAEAALVELQHLAAAAPARSPVDRNRLHIIA